MKGWGLQPGMEDEEQQQRCPRWIPTQTIKHRQDLRIVLHCGTQPSKFGPVDAVFGLIISPQHWQTVMNQTGETLGILSCVTQQEK